MMDVRRLIQSTSSHVKSESNKIQGCQCAHMQNYNLIRYEDAWGGQPFNICIYNINLTVVYKKMWLKEIQIYQI